jgi:hypothetical protein
MGLAGMAGAVGGFVGTPGDMVNIHKILFYASSIRWGAGLVNGKKELG